MKKALHEFYLDWVNNFISTAGMSQYYGIPEPEVIKLIEIGRKIHNKEK